MLEQVMLLALGLTLASCLQVSDEATPPQLLPGAWQVLGPLPRRARGPFGASGGLQPQLGKMRQEGAWPALEAAFKGKGGMQVPWMALDPEAWLQAREAQEPNPRPRQGLDSGELELLELLPLARADASLAEDATAYLYRRVLAVQAQAVKVQLESSGPAAIWLNGVRVGVTEEQAGVASWRGELLFRTGNNHLLLEVQHPQDGPWQVELQERRHISQAEIDRAIDRGVDYLLARQAIDGRWYPYGGGYLQASNAIAVYTLLACGLSPRHEAILKGLDHLRRERSPRTYSAALQLMALVAAGDAEDHELIRDLTADLISWQLSNGLWSYDGSGGGPGPGGGDLSNTQYAALGLRAAVAAGISVPGEVWEKLTQGTLDCGGGASSRRGPVTGEQPGVPVGFGYGEGGGHVYPSMTAAGIGTLAICADNLPADGNRNLATRARRGVVNGIAWLGANWQMQQLEGNFLGADGRKMWDYYYLYGLERAGVLGGAERFGEHDWYREGARLLVDQQEANGGWGEREDPVTVCFALLFLKRATAQPPVTNQSVGDELLRETKAEDGPLLMRAKLRHPPALWIDRQSQDFADILKVLYWLKPPQGDWQRFTVTEGELFAMQPQLDMPGDWSMRADAQLIDGSLLSSGTIEFTQKDGLIAERRAYLRESEGNQLVSNPQVSASSTAPGFSPSALVDHDPFTSWACAGDDAEPSLALRLRRRVRGERLSLTPLWPQATDSTHPPRPVLVELRLNDKEWQTLRIPSDPHAKAVLPFAKEMAISRIELRVLAVSGATLGQGASVGFAEIEVL